MSVENVLEQNESAARGCVRRVVRTRQTDYAVWRQQHSVSIPSKWILTGHKLKARTNREAQSRLKRVFEGCGFSSMSLIAMPVGESPNDGLEPSSRSKGIK